MKQREVTDQNSTTWTCVQAYAGGLKDEENDKAATKLSENKQGFVPIVCTPSGGAQSVRLELPKDWMDAMTDEELSAKITAAQSNS